MGQIRSFVEFHAPIPDDSKWSAAGDIIIPPGRMLAESIRFQLLATFNCSTVRQHSFYGWSFFAIRGMASAFLLLQPGQQNEDSHWLVTCEASGGMVNRVLSGLRSSFVHSVITEIDLILTNDSNISHIAWYTKHEYEHHIYRHDDCK